MKQSSPYAWWMFVLVAIVGLFLILRMTSTWGQPRYQATQCLSNVKVQGVALATYCQDWDDHYPIVNWQTAIGKYVKRYGPGFPYSCPEVLERGARFGYAMDWQLLGREAAKVADPARVPLVFETDALGMDVAANLAAVAKDRHKGTGSEVCYADTHAKWRRKEEWP